MGRVKERKKIETGGGNKARRICRPGLGSLLVALFVVLLFSGAFSSAASAQGDHDILVIANKGFVADKISVEELRRIFTKKQERVKGVKVVPVHAKADSGLKVEFVRKLFGQTLDEDQAFWQDAMVREGKRPPAGFSNTVRAVFSMRTAVSYCYRKDFKPKAAKILRVL